MNTFLIGTGAFDESFACTNTDEELLTYLGASWRSTLTSHIHKADVEIFRERVRQVTSGDLPQSRTLIRFIAGSGETRICRVRIYKCPEEKKVFIEVIDIENACDGCLELLDIQKRTEWFLNFEDELLINYHFLTKECEIFKFTDNGRMTLSNSAPYDTLAQLVADDLESREVNFSYHTEFEIDGEAFLLTGSIASRNNERTMMYGIVRKKDGKDERLSNWGDTHDALTGLYNRPYALSEAKRMVNEHGYVNISFIILDIDGFKIINETFGSAFGNKVLQKLSVILNEAARGRGVVARYSGDSFFMSLIDIKNEDELRALLHGIIFKLQNAFPDVDYRFTLSIGVAEYPRNSMDYEILLKKAERALYIAKFKGKARYIIYKETMHGEITEEAADENMKPASHNREEQYAVAKNILSSVISANDAAPGNLCSALDSALVTLLLKYRCDALTVYSGSTYLPVFRKGHYPEEPESAFFLRNPKVRALFNNRGINYIHLDHIHGEPIEEYHIKMRNSGLFSSLQIIIGENNSPVALFSYDCFNDLGNYTQEEINDLLFFSHMFYAIMAKCGLFR